MAELACPSCGGTRWKAVETRSFLVPCELIKNDSGEIEIELDPMAEFMQESSVGFTSAYMCADDDCGHTVAPDQVTVLKEAGNGTREQD